MRFYNFDQYCWMIADEYHSQPFVQALRKSVTDESVVLDIGCGTGIYSLLACQFGAKKVFAIEPNPLIWLAKSFAAQYGFQDKIEFIQNISTNVELEQKADVLICDLHVDTPFNELSVFSIIDARKRLLKPNAVLIPQKDSMFFALVECEEFFEKNIARYLRNYYGIDMSSAKYLLTNRILAPNKDDVTLISESKIFSMLNYNTLEEFDFSAKLNWEIKKKGIVHGLLGWFDCELIADIKITNAIDNLQTIYGVPFFPFEQAVSTEIGDVIESEISVKLENGSYVWNWNTKIFSTQDLSVPKVKFIQSTAAGVFVQPNILPNHSEFFLPIPNEKVKIDSLFLSLINGEMFLGDIADVLVEKFPDQFKTFAEAFDYASLLSLQYSK